MTDPITDTPDALPTEEALDLLDAALTDLDEQAPRLAESGTDAELVRLLYAVRERRQRLAGIEAYLEARVAQEFGKGEHDVAGLRIEVHSGTRTKWKDPRTLAWRVVEPVIGDPITGEYYADPNLVAEMLDRLFGVLAVQYFRTRALRSLGIDYDDVVSVERGRRTVQFREIDPGQPTTADGEP